MVPVLFYYKDTDLINSLYAQLFSGLVREISTVETGDEDNSLAVEGKGDAGVSTMIAKGNFGIKTTARSSLKSSESRHETLIPHDAVILDVLEKLGPAAKNSVANAKRGNIINIKGSLLFFPKEIEANSIQPMIPFFETLLAPQLTSMDKKQKNALLEIVKSFFKTGSDNCRFIFKTESGEFLTGYMKRNDFTQDSLSLFFKYKGSMIPCQLIGILETHANEKMVGDANEVSFFQGLLGIHEASAEIWSSTLPDGDPVTPIAFFQPVIS
jgi:hypothetical protein